jgi:hypothetical protein
MKKQLLLLATFIVSTFTFAQTDVPSFGIKAGITSASMQGEAADNLNNLLDFTKGGISTSSKTGVYAGVFTNIPLTDVISLEPSLEYAQKGYALKGALNLKGLDFLGANAKATLTSHYIEIPLLLKANLNGLLVFLGPEVAYMAKADLKMSAGVLGFNLLKNTSDATDQFNRWDAGVTGGVGYQFENGFSVNAAYDYGLARTDANQSLNAYNRTFKVGMGLKF